MIDQEAILPEQTPRAIYSHLFDDDRINGYKCIYDKRSECAPEAKLLRTLPLTTQTS